MIEEEQQEEITTDNWKIPEIIILKAESDNGDPNHWDDCPYTTPKPKKVKKNIGL